MYINIIICFQNILAFEACRPGECRKNFDNQIVVCIFVISDEKISINPSFSFKLQIQLEIERSTQIKYHFPCATRTCTLQASPCLTNRFPRSFTTRTWSDNCQQEKFFASNIWFDGRWKNIQSQIWRAKVDFLVNINNAKADEKEGEQQNRSYACLLYTSDAADE